MQMRMTDVTPVTSLFMCNVFLQISHWHIIVEYIREYKTNKTFSNIFS